MVPRAVEHVTSPLAAMQLVLAKCVQIPVLLMETTNATTVTTFTSPTKNVMVLKMITEERHLTNVKLNVLKTAIVDFLIGQHMEVQIDVMQELPTVDVGQ